jgi:glycine hydroxymethyltransferase
MLSFASENCAVTMMPKRKLTESLRLILFITFGFVEFYLPARAFNNNVNVLNYSPTHDRRMVLYTTHTKVIDSNSHVGSTTSEISNQDSKLQEYDPVLAKMIQNEEHRQKYGLELIASENFCSPRVKEVLGSCLTNKYSEGYPGKRYYGGNEYIDQIETICIERALSLYRLNPNEWGVNVQPYSGSPANFAAYTALLEPHDRIMGLDLPSGGHLTHGFQTSKKRVSATSVYFESMPYIVNDTGYIDYDELERRAVMFLPKLIIGGGSAYPREWDYKRMRQIADKVGAILLIDMAHISGLVAADVVKSPFDFADVVTTTTHKSLRGPRSGMIFAKSQYMDSINSAVFPSLQGGPHNHQIGALAVALKEAGEDNFKQYANQIILNAKALAIGLEKRGHTIATGGTDNHLMLWNVRAIGLTGSKVENILERASMTTNKNSIPGDISALNPGGVRLGTPALTTRGFLENDFDIVAEYLHQGCQIALDIQTKALSKTNGSKVPLKDFLSTVDEDVTIQKRLSELKMQVEDFASKFYMP